ncbi:1,4-alpha-glucan branching protein GlgB [Allobaculum fili]|uniref:1,4-alpha-glucan branching protein GlgB n=1 Tax=Allobaculum fili TaxID=2834460 RepID=UPI001E32539C|nr:1,4-alpha-glucan branching protein GlgB [Allobaculum fili]
MKTMDLTAFFQGRELNAYEYFGAHAADDGIAFRVYAPNAKAVSVIGDFNSWDETEDVMKKDENGVWMATVKNAKPGEAYLYQITSKNGQINNKIDPFAFQAKLRPDHDSIITDLAFDGWTDQEWMKNRNKGFNSPVSIYEMNVGSWRDKNIRVEELENDPGQNEEGLFVHYGDIVDELILHCKKYHFSHVEVMPLSEFPFDGSWGYQVSAFFAVTSRYGTPIELKEFVNRLHEAGIGVIMDFVPVHFVKDAYALASFDGTPLYEYSKPEDANSEWGTANFDLWKETVRSFLMSAANYWLKEYHFDGLRMDAISNAIFWKGNKMMGENKGATDFIKRMNYMLNSEYQGKIMLIAEDSTDFPNVCKSTLDGGLGFDYKWDLGWMNDTLKYLKLDPIYRKWHHNDITFSMAYFYSEHFILPLSHDEVVHGKATIVDKMWGSYEDKFAQARALYTYMFGHPGKKLNFMGNELGMLREWDEQKGCDWFLRKYPMHSSFERFFAEMTGVCTENDAFFYGYDPTNFQWINADDSDHNTFSFMRKGSKDVFVFIINFSTNPYTLQFGVPFQGMYQEVINTQWSRFGGRIENEQPQVLRAFHLPLEGQPWRINVQLPALGAQIFKVTRPQD